MSAYIDKTRFAANVLENIDSKMQKKKKVVIDPLSLAQSGTVSRAVREAGYKGLVPLSYIKAAWKIWCNVALNKVSPIQAVMELVKYDRHVR